MPQMALGVHPHAFRSSAAPPNRQFAPADQYLFCPGYRPAAWLKCFASGWQAPASAPTTVSTRPIRVVTAAKRRGVSLICVHFLHFLWSTRHSGSAQRAQRAGHTSQALFPQTARKCALCRYGNGLSRHPAGN